MPKNLDLYNYATPENVRNINGLLGAYAVQLRKYDDIREKSSVFQGNVRIIDTYLNGMDLDVPVAEQPDSYRTLALEKEIALRKLLALKEKADDWDELTDLFNPMLLGKKIEVRSRPDLVREDSVAGKIYEQNSYGVTHTKKRGKVEWLDLAPTIGGTLIFRGGRGVFEKRYVVAPLVSRINDYKSPIEITLL